MKNIKINSAILHNEKRLLLYFPYDIQVTDTIKGIPGRKWSSSNKCWHIEDTKENREILFKTFKGIAWLDFENTNIKNQITKARTVTNTEKNENLDDTKTSKINNFRYWLKSRRYSENTIKTYIDALKTFLNFYNSKTIESITNEDIIKFNNEYILKNKYSASFQNQVVNAIKLFYKTIEKVSIDPDLIHRPKRSHQLPNVLSKEEVKAILNAPTNLKHKAMLSLIYACGLRRSELLNLKPTDIDSKRNLLIIKNAKGRKDRIAPISNKLIDMLREYYISFKPQVWLFEGQNTGEKYSEQSLQSVLKRSVEKVKIKKSVTLHWLRHSYATHLLESGTDLRYIQELLGHKSSTTTEIYTHVSTKSIQNIKTPFDDL